MTAPAPPSTAAVSRMSVWQLLAMWLLGQHRRKQDAIADTVRNGVVRSWPVLRFTELDATQVTWIDTVLPSVRYGFERSQQATAGFLSDYAQVWSFESGVELPDSLRTVTASRYSAVDPRLGEDRGSVRSADPFDAVRVAAVLGAVGPGTVKAAMPAPQDVASAAGLKAAAGFAVRAAMDGGRGVAQDEIQSNNVIVGYQRITDGDPCYFCALLASRGPVYKGSASFQVSDGEKHTTRAGNVVQFLPNAAFVATGEPDGIAKVHDHCRCTLVPVFEGFEQLDPWGKVALRLWGMVGTMGDGSMSPSERLNAYRRAYDKMRSSNPLGSYDVPASVVIASVEDALKTSSPSESRFLRSQLKRLRTA